MCITSKHLCTAGLGAHDPSCKTAKFTVKLSATCHPVVGKCGEARGEATHLRT